MGAAESGLMEFLGDVIEWFADPEHWSGPGGIPARTLQHLGYSGLALVVASVIALPLGLYVGHTRKHEFLVVSLATVWRALPSLAVLGVVFILLVRVGLGFSLLPT
ncbi:MAG TPA: hypothetical protein VEA19_02105, partial [Actinomycetota bacterium]|nr:hypothetical protein [Actinomycetota bacterium]